MSKPGLYHPIGLSASVEPVQERSHFALESFRGRRLEMDAFPAYWTRHDLHRAGCVVTPGTHPDSLHSAAAGRKQRGMPREQSLGRNRFIEVTRRIEHHFDDAFHVPVPGFVEPDSVHPPHDTPLLVTDTSESFSQSVMIPMKVGPIRAIMDIQAHSPHFMRRI